MRITDVHRNQVAQALKDSDIKAAELAGRIGVSKSWMTRFFDSETGVKTLRDQLKVQIEHYLEIKLEDTEGPSLSAHRFDQLMARQPKVAGVLENLLMTVEQAGNSLPEISAEEQLKLGVFLKKLLVEQPDIEPLNLGEATIDFIEKQNDRRNQEAYYQQYS